MSPHLESLDVSLQSGQHVVGVEGLPGCQRAGTAVTTVEEPSHSLDDDRCGDGVDVAAGDRQATRDRPMTYDDVHDEPLRRAPALVGRGGRWRAGVTQIVERTGV